MASLVFCERVRGIEPLSTAWKAIIINHYTIPAFATLRRGEPAYCLAIALNYSKDLSNFQVEKTVDNWPESALY